MRNIPRPRLLEILARLNQIGAAIQRQDSQDPDQLAESLQEIARAAAEMLGDSAVTICSYDAAQARLEPAASALSPQRRRTPAGEASPVASSCEQELGLLAIQRQQRILSYEEPGVELLAAGLAQGAQAAACFPLPAAGENLGVLTAWLHSRASFSELDLLALENCASLAGMALGTARRTRQAQDEQARREKELRRLRRAGMLISSRASLKDTLEVILRMALEVMDAQYGILRLVDSSRANLVTQAIAGERLGRPAVETLPIDGHSIMGLVAMKREPVVVGDLRQEPWNHIYYPFDRELVMRSELAVPLMGAGDRLEGVLNLESPQRDAFSKQDRYILQILATQAVAAIQEARLLDALQEISGSLLTQPPAAMHRGLVEKACDLLNVPASLIWLVQGEELVLQAAAGVSGGRERTAVESSLAGLAIRAGQPVSLAAVSPEQAAAPDSLGALQPGCSVLIVPVFAEAGPAQKSRPVGAFSVYSAAGEGRDFEQSDWERKVLSILGHYAILSLQNAARQEALQAAQEQRLVAETFAAVGDIASNLMHQLNNKIGSIPVRVQGIQDKSAASLAQDAYLARNLEEIERSASSALEAMRETLFHLRPVQFSPVCIADSVREALGAARLPPGVRVSQHGLEDLPCVSAGPRRLALVFVNLLENAADAMGGQGVIEIGGQAQEAWIEVRVSDSGPGIPPELHERIFEFNYSTRVKELPGKLGFGLWWVKTMVARYGGRVSVESDGRTGTTFILELPRAEAGT